MIWFRTLAALGKPCRYQAACLRICRMAMVSPLISQDIFAWRRIMATTALRSGRSGRILPSRAALISAKSQGFPLAALAAMTASHPVSSIICRAFSPEVMSPLPMTGTDRASFTSRMTDQSASPEYIWTLVLPWTATAAAPPAWAARAHSTALTWASSIPFRILTVTGRSVWETQVRTISSILPGSFIRADPSPLPKTLGTGHPMLISRMSKGSCPIFSRAPAKSSGSRPKSWRETGASAGTVS